MPKEKNNLPSQKIAVLIDGGFFLKRFNALYNKDGKKTAEDIANAMYTMAHSHVGSNNILYRIFYYDCKPLEKKFHNPITHKVFPHNPAAFPAGFFCCGNPSFPLDNDLLKFSLPPSNVNFGEKICNFVTVTAPHLYFLILLL